MYIREQRWTEQRSTGLYCLRSLSDSVISPESILRQLIWREMLRNEVYQENLVAFVIDEAHCMEKWYDNSFALYFSSYFILSFNRGVEFRLEFAHISEVRALIPPNTKLMALTATATAKIRKLIISSLDMGNCHLVICQPNKVLCLPPRKY